MASRTSKSTDHSIRGTPKRFDSGPNTLAGNRDAFSDRLSALMPSKKRRGRDQSLRMQVPRDVLVVGVGMGQVTDDLLRVQPDPRATGIERRPSVDHGSHEPRTLPQVG